MTVIPGRFSNGRNAVSQSVQVELTPTGLDIRDQDGLLVALWRRQDLEPPFRLPDKTGIVLRCLADPDARLITDSHPALAPLLPPARRAVPWRGIGLTITAIAVVAVGIWQGLPLGARLVANAIPFSVEQRWGNRLALGLEERWGRCQGPAGQAALTLLADKLAAQMPRTMPPPRVVVVKNPLENAIALPGGTVMIFEGLLKNAGDSDEIAGAMAHEFAHIANRHPAAAMVRSLGVGAIVLLMTGDASGVLATGAAMVLGGAYSRDDETTADREGAILLIKAGLDPRGMARFFRRIAQKPGQIPEWLANHPDSQGRAADIDSLAPNISAPPALSESQWQALKGICGG